MVAMFQLLYEPVCDCGALQGRNSPTKIGYWPTFGEYCPTLAGVVSFREILAIICKLNAGLDHDSCCLLNVLRYLRTAVRVESAFLYSDNLQTRLLFHHLSAILWRIIQRSMGWCRPSRSGTVQRGTSWQMWQLNVHDPCRLGGGNVLTWVYYSPVYTYNSHNRLMAMTGCIFFLNQLVWWLHML